MYLVNEEDIETIDYSDDTSIVDVISKKGAALAANKIKEKYKEIRTKRNNSPFDLNGVEKAETINYVDNTDIADLKLNKNAVITAKKISDKYKKLARRRKRERSPEPTEGPIKTPRPESQSKKSSVIAVKKITEKYKKNEK